MRGLVRRHFALPEAQTQERQNCADDAGSNARPLHATSGRHDKDQRITVTEGGGFMYTLQLQAKARVASGRYAVRSAVCPFQKSLAGSTRMRRALGVPFT